jgi:hypothetical protein
MTGSVSSMPDPVAAASLDSVDAAHAAAAHIGGDAGSSLIASADQAFVNAMSTTTNIAAAVAMAGAIVATLFLPSRSQPADVKPVEHHMSELEADLDDAREAVLV